MLRAAQYYIRSLTSSNVFTLQINVLEFRLCSRTVDIQSWIDTLNGAEKQRIRFIRNEVNANNKFAFKCPENPLFGSPNRIDFFLHFQLALQGVENEQLWHKEEMTKMDYEMICSPISKSIFVFFCISGTSLYSWNSIHLVWIEHTANHSRCIFMGCFRRVYCCIIGTTILWHSNQSHCHCDAIRCMWCVSTWEIGIFIARRCYWWRNDLLDNIQ